MTNKKPYLVTGVIAAALGFAYVQMDKAHLERSQQQDHEIAAAEDAALPLSLMTTQSLSGNYLAARFAVVNDDLASANNFYERAISAADTPEMAETLYQHSLAAAIGAGDMDVALKIAERIDITQPTATAQLAVLTLLVDGFKHDDIAKVQKLLPALRDDGFGRLLKPLLQAWADAGQKNYVQASATLMKLAKAFPSLMPLVKMHLAYLADLQGNPAAAERDYMQTVDDHLSIRSAYIIGGFFERQGDKAKAAKIYQSLSVTLPNAPMPQIILDRVQRGDLHKTPFIQKPSDGVAAALYDVATVLYQESSSRLAILYAQMAHSLAPKDEFTNLLLGDILSGGEVSDQAEEFFQSVPEGSDLYTLSQLRLAQFYEAREEFPKTLAILEKLEKNSFVKRQALMELGDFYRRREEFPKAIPYYSQVLEMTPKLTENDWVILYARGICYERANQWDKAEADLTNALKLSPQQPEVLNYLAYSWADHGKNLPKALEMLQKALEGAPEDPYISDSVGWALYKSGHFEEAVPYLELSVQKLPDDPVINDHLGDIYWAADRQLEAQFQWNRALQNIKTSTDENEKLRKQINQKLEDGPKDVPAASTEAAPEPANDQDADHSHENSEEQEQE